MKISQDVLGFLEEPVSAKETGDTDDEWTPETQSRRTKKQKRTAK